MSEENTVRADKFLWAVRIYKTRSQAAEACKKGHITINDVPVKPSRVINNNEIIKVKKLPVIYSYKVISLLNNRVSASLVKDFINDITPASELEKKDINERGGFYFRDRGTGRPTKKDRRIIDKLTDSSEDFEL